jgi:homoserine kinase
MKASTRCATAFAPASIGNVGPGFDVLGLAVEGIGDTVSIELRGDGDASSIEVTGLDAKLVPSDPQKNAAAVAARAWFEPRGITAGFHMRIHKGISMSAGMGGSGASSVAGALAAAAACGAGHPSPAAVMEAALAGESAVAGRHLDNIAATVLGGLALVRSIDPIDAMRLPVASDWRLVLATPRVRLETRHSRSVLPRSSERELWVQQMANAIALAHAFGTGDSELLRRALDDLYAEPHRAHLIPRFGPVKRAAIDAGALGCSISGAGPTIFAIAEPARAAAVGSAMERAFEDIPTDLHVTGIAREGARIVEAGR